MPTFETYPVATRSPVDQAVVITQIQQDGTQETTVLGPFTQMQALQALGTFARTGDPLGIDLAHSLVLEISEREVLVVHESFWGNWTARAVIGTYVKGAS